MFCTCVVWSKNKTKNKQKTTNNKKTKQNNNNNKKNQKQQQQKNKNKNNNKKLSVSFSVFLLVDLLKHRSHVRGCAKCSWLHAHTFTVNWFLCIRLQTNPSTTVVLRELTPASTAAQAIIFLTTSP